MSGAPPENALDSASRFRAFVDDGVVGAYVSTPAGRLVFCNPAFAAMLGFASVDDALAAPVAALYENLADRDRFLRRLHESGRVAAHRIRLRRADGRAVEVLDTAVGQFDTHGRLVEILGQLVDVSDWMATEAALREREQQFHAVFNEAADAILILDGDRHVVDANEAARRLFGLPADDLGTVRLDDLFAGGDRVAGTWSELLALGEAKREHRVTSAGGARGIIECSYRARVHNGRHLCIARDITERRRLEERLQQSEKIETVGRLAGGIAHDFNNLLTAMLGYTELLLATRSASDPERPDLEEIQRAGQRAAALTQQLLAFSRKQVLLPKELDLNDAVTGLRPMLAGVIREDVALAIEPAAIPAIVRLDPSQFEQALLNLVINARDAMPAGGRIVLSIDHVAIGETEAAADRRVPPGEYVRVRVSDTGVGMSPEVQAHLFEPFFTTKDLGKGTGLGLASVHGIVRQSNGFITAQSGIGAGSTFSMYFLAVGPPRGEGQPAAPPAARRATVLLVEDEDAVRVIVSAVLRRNGYYVLEASGPRGALDIFAHQGSDVDLLVTDVVMPEMNGPALAQRLVAERAELRVLFISGYADVAKGAIDSENPNVGFLSKPFAASLLIDRVREILARPRPARGAL